MVAIDAEAMPEMPMQGRCQRGRCCLLEGISLVPVQSGEASDLMKLDTYNSCLALTTFSQQILAVATTTKAYKGEMFYFYCIFCLKS